MMDSGIIREDTMTNNQVQKESKKKNVVREKNLSPTKKVSIQKFKDLEGKFLLVKVGSEAHPSSSADILDIQEKLVNLLENNDVNCLVFVTHHAVEINIVEKG